MISDMQPGTHTAEVTFQLGAAYELVSCDPLQIIVHDRTEESKESMETESQAETEEESASASEQS